ncbi:hypothetical protein [Desulfocurvibacter africanus]|uniref:hypothetical protein n=1 Tax=Desulfocurvibacter africanus TaxID=873 RepID=UPI000416A92B|nr:hypothetical protein [Desulfocurvibacter africanus]
MSVDESFPPMTPAVITVQKLQDLVAIWAMLAGMPRAALLEQLKARHDISDIETAVPEALQAAGVYVLRQNDALLLKGRQVSRDAVREYQTYMQGEPEEPEAVTAFWQQYEQLNAKLGPNGERGWLNHSKNPGQIAINFNQFIEACRRHCQLAPDMPSLRKQLPESYPRRFVAANRGVYSKHAKKNMRCWVFQLPS